MRTQNKERLAAAAAPLEQEGFSGVIIGGTAEGYYHHGFGDPEASNKAVLLFLTRMCHFVDSWDELIRSVEERAGRRHHEDT